MKGISGKYLQVDLSNEKIGDYKIPESWYQKHLGGRGIAARIFLKEVKQGIDPMGEENILIFATGPFQGTGIPGGGRNLVMSKSPKTNAVSIPSTLALSSAIIGNASLLEYEIYPTPPTKTPLSTLTFSG